MPCSAHTSASAGSGSTAPVEVVPAVAATQNGTRPAARSASTAAPTARGRQPEVGVRLDHAELLAREAEHAQRARHRRVPLVGHVGDRLGRRTLAEVRGPRRRQRHQARDRPAAHEHALGAGGQPAPLAQPVEHDQLDGRRARAARPRPGEHVEARRQPCPRARSRSCSGCRCGRRSAGGRGAARTAAPARTGSPARRRRHRARPVADRRARRAAHARRRRGSAVRHPPARSGRRCGRRPGGRAGASRRAAATAGRAPGDRTCRRRTCAPTRCTLDTGRRGGDRLRSIRRESPHAPFARAGELLSSPGAGEHTLKRLATLLVDRLRPLVRDRRGARGRLGGARRDRPARRASAQARRPARRGGRDADGRAGARGTRERGVHHRRRRRRHRAPARAARDGAGVVHVRAADGARPAVGRDHADRYATGRSTAPTSSSPPSWRAARRRRSRPPGWSARSGARRSATGSCSRPTRCRCGCTTPRRCASWPSTRRRSGTTATRTGEFLAMTITDIRPPEDVEALLADMKRARRARARRCRAPGVTA